MDMPEAPTSGGYPPLNVPRMFSGSSDAGLEFDGFAAFASSPRRSVPPSGSNAPPIFRPSAPTVPMLRFRGPSPAGFDMPPPLGPQYHNDHDHPDELDWLEEINYVNPWGVGARNIRSPGLMPRD